MNLHPVFVHFPIGLLTIYAILEIISIKKLKNLPYWFYVKAVLVIVGATTFVPTLITGLIAGKSVVENSVMGKIVDLHEKFAFLSVAVFGFLAICYLVVWVSRQVQIQNQFLNRLTPIAKFFVESKFAVVLAVVGFCLLTITGGLGGRMVYGPDADPFLKPVLDFILR